MRLFNPFITVGYESPQYFCDRKKETQRIISAMENGRNVTLISLRRMGKTGLIRHVFHKLSRNKNTVCVYVDFMPTNDLESLIKNFGLSIFSGSKSLTAKTIKTLSGFFSNLKLSIAYDPLTGSPSLSLSPSGMDDNFKSLNEIFKYISSQDNHFIIAFDEFQQILNYKEKNITAHLRSNIQKIGNANFIFSGSQKHTLLSMFTSHDKPFYQSTEIMNLENIEKKDYIEFIIKNFNISKSKVNYDIAEYILDKTNIHTYYVQFLCNKLFSLNLNSIGKKDIDLAFNDILKENEAMYITYFRLLTNNQWNLLVAIAKEEGIDKPTSSYFLTKYKLGQASSVKVSLKYLDNKELIYADVKGKYFVSDLFFSAWLRQKITYY